MKIWLKVVIAGILIFLAGAFILAGFGLGSPVGGGGIIVSVIGGIIFVVGILAGLTRGFNRMMQE